jgi:HD-like signal output (HDOD) protein
VAPAAGYLEEILDRVRSLPLSHDGAIEEIVEACDASYSTMGDVAERVGREPALAAIIMRQANSAYYGHGRRVETLPDACVLLGIGTIRTLALTNAALRFLAVDTDGLSALRRDLLAHSVTTATAAKVLAARAKQPTDRAFLCGLIHELGAIILTRVAKSEYLHSHVTARTENRTFAEVEHEQFGFDAAELGARLAELWRFPEPICEAIRHQHRPALARDRALADVLHCADWVAAEAGRGLVPFDHPAWPDARAAETCLLNAEALPAVLAEIAGGDGALSIAA